MSAVPVDHRERELAKAWVGGPLLVEAGAGAGKTELLVERALRLIREKSVPVGEIAAITFTKKAALELRERIRARLLAAVRDAKDAEARERLKGALENLESARISTIHSFALNLLRAFPVEAGLPPDLTDVNEVEHEERRDAAWRDWLIRELEGDDPRLRDFLALGFSAADLEKIRDAMLALPEFRESFPRSKGVSPAETRAAIEKKFAAWRSFGEAHCLDGSDRAFQEMKEVESWFGGLSWKSPVDLLREFWSPGVRLNKRVGSSKKWRIDAETGKSGLTSFRQRYDRFLRESVALIGAELLGGVVLLVRGFVESFERETREAGLLSYADILFLAARLVREHPDARERIKGRIRHFLVDEFQDTDPLQVELVFLLTGETEGAADWREANMERANLFLVGDPKQSIYRFRRADIAIYEEVKEKIKGLSAPPELASRILYIRQNFRSVPGVIDFVNRAFGRIISPGEADAGVQLPYVRLSASREDFGPRVFLIKDPEDELDDPEDEPDENASETRRREEEAARLAAAARKLVEEKCEVEEKGGARRPVGYGDVAVLFRTRTGYPQFEDAFRDAGVPFVSDGGRGFYEKFEVGAAIAALSAVARPGDPLALAAALRSPLYGFSDEDIARYFLKDADASGELEEAVSEIHDLHERKKSLSARALLREIYRRAGAFELFLSSSNGEQRVANLLKLMNMAHEFTGDGRRDADAFAAHLAAQEELGRDAREPEALLDAREAGAVRFMTVHQAKGLEFPVVALADVSGRPDGRQKPWLADRRKGTVDLRLGLKGRGLESAGYADALEREMRFQDAERKRLLYVAATRARDFLLWPAESFGAIMEEAGAGDGEMEVIQQAASVLEVSPEARAEPESIFRLPDDVFLPKDGASASVPEERVLREEELKRLKRPAASWRFLAPSGLIKGDGLDAAASEASRILTEEAEIESREAHAGGTAFGELTHGILARLEPPETARLEALREEGLARARALGLGEADVALALGLIRNSVEEGVLARAAAASRRWRELPFTFELDGRLVRGYVDLAFEEAGRLVIVDFKTDRVEAAEAEERASSYVNQGGAYVMGLEAATGREAEELVFSFLRPGVDVSLSVDDALRASVREAVVAAQT